MGRLNCSKLKVLVDLQRRFEPGTLVQNEMGRFRINERSRLVSSIDRVESAVMYSPDTRTWWEKRRVRDNVGLVIAGVLAFVCYVLVVDRGISIGTMPDAEITLFTTAIKGMDFGHDGGRQLLLFRWAFIRITG